MICILHRWKYDFKGKMNSLKKCIRVLRTCRKCGLHQYREWVVHESDDSLGAAHHTSYDRYASISDFDYKQLLDKYLKEGKEAEENLVECLNIGW